MTDPTDIETPENQVIDRLTAGQQEAMERFEAAGQAMVEGWDRSREELAGFVAERIRQDLDAQSALLRSHSLDDVRLVQAHFVETAVSQYGNEMVRLMGLSRDLAVRCLGRS